jgi:PKD repeat protein
MMDVQEAIWYFINERSTSRTLSLEMIEEANDSGIGFCPSSGEIMLIILDGGRDINPAVQGIVIEVTVPIQDNPGGGEDPPNGGGEDPPNGGGGSRSTGAKANKPPIADLSAGEPYQGFVDENITFNGSLSYDIDDYIESWTWDFGDGTTGEGEIIKHSYSSIGEYNVVLTVKDMKGATCSANTDAIIINPNQPPSDPEINGPSEGFTNTEYLFTIVSSDDDKIKYTVDLGDGTVIESDLMPSGVIFNVVHKWIDRGNYKITATADDGTVIATSEKTIEVEEEPVYAEESNIALIILALLALIILILLLIFFKRHNKKE